MTAVSSLTTTSSTTASSFPPEISPTLLSTAAIDALSSAASPPSPGQLAADFSRLSIDEQRRMAALFESTVRQSDARAVSNAIQNGREAVLALLAENKVNPAAAGNQLIDWACRNGDEEIARLLLADARIDPGVNTNAPLSAAALFNHRSIVRMLLADRRVNPESGICFWSMREDSHPKDAVLLLKNPHYNPTVEHCECMLSWAAMNGHLEVVQLLDRINPELNKDKAFKLAAMKGYASIVRCLLSQVDPAFEENAAIRYADNAEVTRLLLTDRRVDPKAKNSASLLMASFHGKADVVQALLEDGRADPGVDLGACLVYAHTKQHDAVVALLMNDPRINPDRHDTYEAWFRDPRRLSRPCTLTENVRITV